jgi:glycosyltransferase involved in cell wall biosynthesis
MSPLRVAVLCDYAEENWPSMELAAAMLLDRLNAGNPDSLRATRIQPRMKRPFQNALGRPGFNADRILNRFWCYPQVARKLRHFDLFHVIDHSYAQLVHRLVPERTIVTCHDIDTFRCLLQPAAERRPRWFRAMVRRTLTGLNKAAAIVCVSDATREQLLHYGIAPPQRVHVVPNGVRQQYTCAPDRNWDIAAERLLGPPGATLDLLHVGSTIPRKRIDVLLRVFAACLRRRPGLRLVRVGSPLTAAQQDLAKALGLQDSILCLPALNAEMLAAVYRRAALVVIPSEAEGFGLPLAEAMACGTPVVASAIPALREVAGGAAVHCPVGAIEDWTEAVLTLLQQREFSPAEWRTRISGGCARAGAFTWDRNAAAMIDIYKTTLSRMGQD